MKALLFSRETYGTVMENNLDYFSGGQGVPRGWGDRNIAKKFLVRAIARSLSFLPQPCLVAYPFERAFSRAIFSGIAALMTELWAKQNFKISVFPVPPAPEKHMGL